MPSATAASASAPGSTTTNSSPPMRAATPPSGSETRSTSATSRRSASPNSWPARSLICLKSSQSRTRTLSGVRPLLCGRELVLEPLLEPAAVEDAREGVGERAPALPSKREGRVERRGDVRCEDGGRVETGSLDLLARPRSSRRARRSPRRWPGAGATRAGARSDPSSAERRQVDELADRARVDERACDRSSSLVKCRAIRSVRAPRRRAPADAELAPRPDLAPPDLEHLRERGRRESRDLRRVAKASEVDEEPGESGQVERSRAVSQTDGQGREQVGQRPQELRRVLGQRALGVEVQHADDDAPGTQRQGDLATPRRAARRHSPDRHGRRRRAVRGRGGRRGP